jgi:hypothetical protein
MTMIDTAIEDVAGRFGLGPKAGQLMHELVHLITGSPSGVSGFYRQIQISRTRLRSHLMARQNRRSGACGSAGREGARQHRPWRDREQARPWERRRRNGYRLYPAEIDRPDYTRRGHPSGHPGLALQLSPGNADPDDNTPRRASGRLALSA